MTVEEIKELVKKSGMGKRSHWRQSLEGVRIELYSDTIILTLLARIDELERVLPPRGWNGWFVQDTLDV